MNKLILALALLYAGAANAGVQAPVVKMGLKSLKADSLGVDSLAGALDMSMESKVSDGITLGANMGFGEAAPNPIKSIYGHVKESIFGRKMNAELSFDLDDSAVTGDVVFGEGGAQGELTASLNTASDGFMVETVKYSREGNGWRVTPTFHTKDFEMDLECETDFSKDTHAKLSLNSQGDGAVKVTHDVQDLAALSFEAGTGLEDVKVGVSKDLNGGDDSLSTTFHAATRHMSMDWTHKLGGGLAGRQLTTSVDQKSQQVDLSLESSSDKDDWALKVSAPWSNPKDADLTLGRKFSMGGLSGLKMPSIRGSSDAQVKVTERPVEGVPAELD